MIPYTLMSNNRLNITLTDKQVTTENLVEVQTYCRRSGRHPGGPRNTRTAPPRIFVSTEEIADKTRKMLTGIRDGLNEAEQEAWVMITVEPEDLQTMDLATVKSNSAFIAENKAQRKAVGSRSA